MSAPANYYVARHEQLLDDFDSFARAVRPLIVAQRGDDEAALIGAEARRAFKALIPQIPYIGGADNPMTANLISAAIYLAHFRALMARGMTASRANEIIHDSVSDWLSSQDWPYMRLLGQLRFNDQYLQTLRDHAAKSQQREFDTDWVFQFVEGDGKTFDYGLDYAQCGVAKFFHAQGADQLLPYICALEWPIYRAMDVRLTREQTIPLDGLCSLRFKRE